MDIDGRWAALCSNRGRFLVIPASAYTETKNFNAIRLCSFLCLITESFLIFVTFLENEIIWNVDNVLPEDVAVVVRMFVEVARLGGLGRLGRL